MGRPKVFISFDFENDRSVKEGVVAQTRVPGCPFDFTDHSIKEPIVSGPWVEEARRLIGEADCVAVLCGRQTHQSNGQLTELQIAKELGRRYVLISATSQHTPTRPKSASPTEPIWPATWESVAALLRGEQPKAQPR